MPDWKEEIRQRLTGLRLAPTREAAIVEELTQHLEDFYTELLSGGAAPAEAERRALAELSESETLRRELRRVERQAATDPIVLGTNRRTNMLNDLWLDLRYCARTLLKQPAFASIAMLTLALGIGANTAIFSVVNAVLLTPPPYAEPERLVAVAGTHTRNPGVKNSISYPDFFDWRDRNRTFDAISVYQSASLTMTGIDPPANLTAQVVSNDLFEVLRAMPHLGRVFSRAEEKPGSGSTSYVAVISDGLWRRQFGADPQVIGRVVTLDRKPFEIIGVMKPGFQFPIQAEPVEVWITPAILYESPDGKRPITERRGFRSLEGIARLKPGISIEEAQADISAVSANLEQEYPENNTGNGAMLIPLHRDLTGDYYESLMVVFAAVACVLLICCANLANLLMASASTRNKEIAVRAALGASRARIIRQLLTESLLLALGGGMLGLLLARAGMKALLGFLPADLPRLSEIAINHWVLGFTFVVSLVTGVVFGLAPALQASKLDLTESMKEGTRGLASSAGRTHFRRALVVTEIAVALVVLICASLLLQTFRQYQQLNLGFDARNVLTAQLTFSETEYAKPQQKIAFVQRVLERVRTLPGVTSVSSILPLPLSGDDAKGGFLFEGRPAERGKEPTAQMRWVSLDYYETMSIPLTAGRNFSAHDDLNAVPVAIVNQAFVKKYLPDENPLTVRLQLPFGADGDSTTVQIVGVVQDVKHQTDLRQEMDPELYMSYAQLPFFNQTSLVVRADVPSGLHNTLQREVAAVDREAVLSDIRTLEQYFGNAVAQPRFSALLFSLFALLALILAAVGLYGLIAYDVAQRKHEIGVRMALGAQRHEVLTLVVKQGMALALAGVVIGLVLAFAVTRWIETLLFNVRPTEPVIFALIAVTLILVALLASCIPAQRATKVDPMVALRYE